jgi:hypothetical protein
MPDPSATSPAGSAFFARLLPIPVGDTPDTSLAKAGVFSLTDFMNANYPAAPAEEQYFQADCFQTAVHRAWSSPNQDVTSAWLVQFGTAAGARSYTVADEQALSGDPTYTDDFRVPRVADGMGYGRPGSQSFTSVTDVLGDAGNVAILITFYTPENLDNAAASLLLQQQYALLSS